MQLLFLRHCSLAVMKALERIANDITKTGFQREFLLYLLEMFVQMGLQIRQLSEEGHRKVSSTTYTGMSVIHFLLNGSNCLETVLCMQK